MTQPRKVSPILPSLAGINCRLTYGYLDLAIQWDRTPGDEWARFKMSRAQNWLLNQSPLSNLAVRVADSLVSSPQFCRALLVDFEKNKSTADDQDNPAASDSLSLGWDHRVLTALPAAAITTAFWGDLSPGLVPKKKKKNLSTFG